VYPLAAVAMLVPWMLVRLILVLLALLTLVLLAFSRRHGRRELKWPLALVLQLLQLQLLLLGAAVVVVVVVAVAVAVVHGQNPEGSGKTREKGRLHLTRSLKRYQID
jgi:phosphoglycerol transferase MdoB-like AlkP superfamily enzyme